MVGQGTTSYTVASVMERLYQSYLTPPDAQGAQVWLGATISDADTTVTLGAFAIPEDEALLRQGSILEVGQELMRVVFYNNATDYIEVVRGEYGTVPVGHADPALMNLNPPYSRANVFEAVADNISLLHPKLFTVVTEYVVSVGDGVYPIEDINAASIMSTWTEGDTALRQRYSDIPAQLVSYHPIADGPAVICHAANELDLWVRLKRRIGRPTVETDTLSSVGVDERWVNIIMAGAAADLLVGRDLSAVQTDWVQNVLEAENIRVGTRMSIAGGLRQYRNMLLEDTAKEIRTDKRKRVRIRSALSEAQ